MYHNDVAGLTHLDKEDHSFSAYRFHEEDPILFHKGLRLTLRCGEEIGEQRHNERVQRWKAPPTTYLYDVRLDLPVVSDAADKRGQSTSALQQWRSWIHKNSAVHGIL